MRHIHIFLVIIFSALPCFSYGQTSSGILAKYENGKDLFGLKKYRLAMEEFRQVTSRTNDNPYLEYASYYFAVSAYHSNQMSVAKSMFYQIDRKYPNWNKIDEVHYWLAKIEFEKNDYLSAIFNLNKIKSPTVKREADNMKAYFLNLMDDIDEVDLLLSKNPYDKIIAERLADLIIKQPIIDQDQNMLSFLISEFELDETKYDVTSIFKEIKKDSYNIGVVLPFMSDNLNGEKLNLGRNLVVDMYEGIKVGVDKLAKSGVKINLFAFDTKRDSVAVMSLINSGELSTMDLIIGPLSQVTGELLSNYCFQQRINMVNPLSYTSRIIGNNPFSFLFKPSLETQAIKAAEYANRNIANRKVKIIYGEAVRDSILAYSYQARIKVDSFEVIGMHKIDLDNVAEISSLMDTSGDDADEENKLGHVFLASDNELMMANVLAALEARGDQLPLIGTESWLNSRIIGYDQIERLGISIISPNFIDFDKDSIENFRRFYHNRTNVFPSKHAFNGYQLIRFFGQMLSDYGIYFQTAFRQKGFIKGEIFEGFDYSVGNDNQYTPLVKFVDANLTVVNR